MSEAPQRSLSGLQFGSGTDMVRTWLLDRGLRNSVKDEKEDGVVAPQRWRGSGGAAFGLHAQDGLQLRDLGE